MSTITTSAAPLAACVRVGVQGKHQSVARVSAYKVRGLCVASARFTSAPDSSGFCNDTDCSSKRVLRYPDGRERLIRYPMQSMNTGPAISGAPMEPISGFWMLDEAEIEAIDATLVAGITIDPQQVTYETAPTADPRGDETEHSMVDSEVPLTAGAFLRWATSEDQEKARKQLYARAKDQYQILDANPYDATEVRQMHVLTRWVQGAEGETAELFTMRTRNPGPSEMQNDLDRMLKPREGSAGPRITFNDMRDGVLAFEDQDEAQRYCDTLVAEDTYGDIDLATVDSEQLFDLIGGADALIVLFRDGSLAPMPNMLTSCLNGSDDIPFDMF